MSGGGGGDLVLLVEVLSCHDLVIGDEKSKSSDPFVKVFLGNKQIHQTKFVKQTLNPIFDDTTDHSFLLECSIPDLMQHDGLVFKIKDYDRFGSHDDLGEARLTAQALLQLSSSKMIPALDLDVVPPANRRKGTEHATGGRIKVQANAATDADLVKFGRKKKGLRGIIGARLQQAKEDLNKANEQLQKATEKAQPRNLFAKINRTTPPSTPQGPVTRPDATASPITTTSKEEAHEESELFSSASIMVGTDSFDDDDLRIIVEIVCGANLLSRDDDGFSDPYVKVKLGNKNLHETKPINNTLNPVWSPETHSTFLLHCPLSEIEGTGLVFKIKDRDRFRKDDELGHIVVPVDDLTMGEGEVVGYEVIRPPGATEASAGYLYIRCRPAFTKDIESLEKKELKNFFKKITAEVAPIPKLVEEQAKTPAPAPARAATDEPSTEKSAPEAASSPAEEDILSETTEVSGRQDLPNRGEMLDLNFEIVKCRDLLVGDVLSSDPYVRVKLAGKEIHHTKACLKTLNPVYSKTTNSTFTLKCPAAELFDSGGLLLEIMDWNVLLKDNPLGSALVPAQKLYHHSTVGDKMEIKIDPPKGQESEDAGFVTIRCWNSDVEPAEPVAVARSASVAIDDEHAPLFVEVVSCRGLISRSKSGKSNPYVKVKLGKAFLHQTKHQSETLAPDYSERFDSSFTLYMPPREVVNSGLTFKVKDYDVIGRDYDLGSVNVPGETLYSNDNGENMEFKLKPPDWKDPEDDAGYITIRCLPAVTKALQNQGIVGRIARLPGGGMFHTKQGTGEFGEPDISLLIEVVSCQGLPKSDLTTGSTDPYVKVKMGVRNVHETKFISKTCDPIYTISSGSLFILDVTTQELQEKRGLTFKVKDFDAVGVKNETLGSTLVPSNVLLESIGERMEFELKGDKGEQAGIIAIRCRPATNYDRDFLAKVVKDDSTGIVGFVPGFIKQYNPFQVTTDRDTAAKVAGGHSIGTTLINIVTGQTKTVDGVKKYRVRPYPDPERKLETEFMSKEEIHAAAMEESRSWIDMGSGDLGRVYVEIIGCDGLPNKDKDLEILGEKTDAFATIVYEDCVAKTDIIDNCLSPRWLPWMQRAFIFRIMHMSSNLYIAVFDFDPGFHDDHDICGRVSVDLSNLRPHTEYLLQYNLYEDSDSEVRDPKGVLTLRLRMELTNEKAVILSNLKKPPEVFVNVKTRKDFVTVRRTIEGRHDLTSYNTRTIDMYKEELFSYLYLKYILEDAVISLLFWRGQVQVCGLQFPMHSITAFLSMITLAEHPYLAPSFFFFGLAWSLLACLWFRNKTPNPWNKSKTIFHFLFALAGLAVDGTATIEAHQNEDAAIAYEEALRKSVEKDKQAAKRRQEEHIKMLKEHEELLNPQEAVDINMETKTGGISLDPRRIILYPIQLYLTKVVMALRVLKNVVTWDEPYFAFLLTLVCIALGLLFLIAPWVFIVRWLFRIIAWCLFGPHMKLVDVFWFSKFEEASEESQSETMRKSLVAQLNAAIKDAKDARIKRENALKQKELKKALFGSFGTSVPILRLERFHDVPLHTSTARPYEPSELQPSGIPRRVGGQHLVGDMIPSIIDDDDVDDLVENTIGEKDKAAKKDE